MKLLNLPKGFSPLEFSKTALAIRRSSQPYYDEPSAKQAEKILRTLHESGTALLVSLGGSKLSTVRLKYYNGIQYLLDNLDPTGELKALYKLTECQAKPNGLLLLIREKPRAPSLENFVIVQATWKADLSRFIEEAGPDDQFFKSNMALTEKDIGWINSQLVGMVKKGPDGEEVPLFYGEINEKQILLIRDKD